MAGKLESQSSDALREMLVKMPSSISENVAMEDRKALASPGRPKGPTQTSGSLSSL